MKTIKCPVLVAWGEEDPWTPLNGSVGKFFTQQAKLRGNMDLVALPGTGKLAWTKPIVAMLRLAGQV